MNTLKFIDEIQPPHWKCPPGFLFDDTYLAGILNDKEAKSDIISFLSIGF